MRVVIWLVEGTWEGCADAAAPFVPPEARVGLLYVAQPEVNEMTEAASAGLLGRAFGWHRATRPLEDVADETANAIMSAAAARLGRPDAELLYRRGRAEREVVRAVAEGTDLLVLARDGDRSRLGPHSLGHSTRFVVDHAPCRVLLVWPDEPPGIETVPPPKPHEPPGPHGPPKPPGPRGRPGPHGPPGP